MILQRIRIIVEEADFEPHLQHICIHRCVLEYTLTFQFSHTVNLPKHVQKVYIFERFILFSVMVIIYSTMQGHRFEPLKELKSLISCLGSGYEYCTV